MKRTLRPPLHPTSKTFDKNIWWIHTPAWIRALSTVQVFPNETLITRIKALIMHLKNHLFENNGVECLLKIYLYINLYFKQIIYLGSLERSNHISYKIFIYKYIYKGRINRNQGSLSGSSGSSVKILKMASTNLTLQMGNIIIICRTTN